MNLNLNTNINIFVLQLKTDLARTSDKLKEERMKRSIRETTRGMQPADMEDDWPRGLVYTVFYIHTQKINKINYHLKLYNYNKKNAMFF